MLKVFVYRLFIRKNLLLFNPGSLQLFSFGSFNNIPKIHPDLFHLKAVLRLIEVSFSVFFVGGCFFLQNFKSSKLWDLFGDIIFYAMWFFGFLGLPNHPSHPSHHQRWWNCCLATYGKLAGQWTTPLQTYLSTLARWDVRCDMGGATFMVERKNDCFPKASFWAMKMSSF